MVSAALPAFSTRFQLVRRLGAGGMGVVYEALDGERNARVALKTLRDFEASSLLRFKHEFRSLQDLVHPNLIALHELFQENGQWFFTMELVSGVDFLGYVRSPGRDGVPKNPFDRDDLRVNPDDETMVDWSRPSLSDIAPPSSKPGQGFDEARLRACLAQLADGLLHLHAAHKVHRDIKPSNVLVTREGRVVILDFGLVAEQQRDSEPSEQSIVGTAAYMAPEQAASKPLGPEADWYAVGAVLYEALTGQLPFDGSPVMVLMHKQLREPPPPRSIVPAVPEDLEALCMELLRFEPARRPTGAEIARRLGLDAPRRITSFPPPSSLSGGVPFVGRGKELLALERAWEVVRTGKAVTVYLHGESGVGKSALVDRFVGNVGEPDGWPTLVLRGRCYERESVPYKALDGVIDALSRSLARMKTREIEPLLPNRATLLAQVFPVLRRVEAFAHAPRESFEALDPQELRSRLFGAFRELFANLSALVHLVIVIDDLQWSDADSMALLREVLRVPDAPPVLLLLTLRAAPELGVPTSQLNAGSNMLPGEVRALPIGRLSEAESLDLAQKLIARSGPEAGANAASLAREAQGHPLFIEELVRYAAVVGSSGAVVSKLEDALRARIEVLPAQGRAILELLAIAGHPVGREELERAAGIEDASDFERSLSVLRAGRFVRTASTGGKKALEPFHDKVRAAVLGHLGDDEKQSGHARLAVALEASPRPDAEALAEHWRGAGDIDKAADYAARAAEEAQTAFAFDRAARLYRLVLLLRVPPEEELRSLRRRLADALANAGRGAEAAEMYLEAGLGATRGEALELRRRAATQLLLSGHVEEGLSTLRTVLNDLGLKFPQSTAAAIRGRLLRRAWLKVRGLGFEERDPSMIADAERVRIDVCWSLGLGLGNVDPARGSDFQVQGLLRALASGDAYRISRALSLEAAYVASEGVEREREARELFERAEELAKLTQSAHAQAVTALARAFALYLWGRYADAIPQARRAEQNFRERCNGAQTELDIAIHVLLRSLFFLGDFVTLRAQMPIHLREAGERGNLYALHGLRTGHLIGCWLADDDPDGALVELEDAAQGSWDKGNASDLRRTQVFIGHAMIAIYAERPGALYEQGVAILGDLKRSSLQRVQLERVDLFWVQARLALATALLDRPKAAERLREAEALARRLEREHMPSAAPASLLIHGAVLAQRGEITAALRAVERAAKLFEDLSMRAFACIARRASGVIANDARGAALVVDAEEDLRVLGVVRAERFADAYAPGFRNM